MQTKHAIKLAGGTASALAAVLGITRGAVTQWDVNVPKARLWQLQILRPEWFSENVKNQSERTADTVTTTAG